MSISQQSARTGSDYRRYLPDQWFQLRGGGGQTDAEGDGVRAAGDGAGDDGASHGEGQHGVDDEHDEQEEGHLETGGRDQMSFTL